MKFKKNIAPNQSLGILYSLVAFVLFITTSCTTADQSDGHLLSPRDVVSKIESTTDIIVVDVRTPAEYNDGHIEGAQLINWNDSQFENQINQLDKSKPIVVYCAVGGRSGKAYARLKTLGFKEVFDMKGGFDAWRKEQLPISK